MAFSKQLEKFREDSGHDFSSSLQLDFRPQKGRNALHDRRLWKNEEKNMRVAEAVKLQPLKLRLQLRFQIRIYIHIYICGRTSSYMHMLNSSLLGNKKLRGLVVCNVGGIKYQPISKA